MLAVADVPHTDVATGFRIAFPVFRDRANHLADALASDCVSGGEGAEDVAVVQDRIVDAILLDDVVEGLDNQVGFDSISGHLTQVHGEKVQPSERRELIQRQKKAMVLRTAGAVAVQKFHQRPARLIDHQPNQRAQSRRVRWRRLDVKRHGPVRAHQVGKSEIAGGGISGDDVIRPQREIAGRRAGHAGLKLRRLAAEFVGNQRHFRVNLRRTSLRIESVRRGDHRHRSPLEVQQSRPHGCQVLELIRLGIQNMQDQRHQKLAGLLVPNVHRVFGTSGVHQHFDDVLRIAHFVVALSNLKEWVETGAVGPRGIEEQAVTASGRIPAVMSHNSFFTS